MAQNDHQNDPRPQRKARGNAVAAQQMAHSNATTQLFLGRGRQYNWLHGGDAGPVPPSSPHTQSSSSPPVPGPSAVTGERSGGMLLNSDVDPSQTRYSRPQQALNTPLPEQPSYGTNQQLDVAALEDTSHMIDGQQSRQPSSSVPDGRMTSNTIQSPPIGRNFPTLPNQGNITGAQSLPSVAQRRPNSLHGGTGRARRNQNILPSQGFQQWQVVQSPILAQDLQNFNPQAYPMQPIAQPSWTFQNQTGYYNGVPAPMYGQNMQPHVLAHNLQRSQIPVWAQRQIVPSQQGVVARNNVPGMRSTSVPNGPTPAPSPSMQSYPKMFPPPGLVLGQSTDPDPMRTALHQAHLNTPVAKKLDEHGREQPDIRLYQYFHSFVMPPALLGVTEPFFMWAFSISADDKRRATPPAEQPTWDRLGSRWYADGACLFRLRCIDIPKDMSRDQLREEYWTVKDNVWPSTCFVTLNGHPLELRRKIHHGKDLPLDLTHYVIEGINTLEFSLLQAFAEVSKKSYAVAVERVEVGNTNRVRQAVGSVAAEDALASILSTLQARQDDEDLILVDPHLSVEVTDPFSSRIFDIPVRSVHCLHKECFDLEIFLASRKSRTQGAPTNPDEWKCPICRCDARPMNLVIDGFLEHVRQTLETLGALDTKAILVQADGTWTSKEGGDTSDSHSRKRDVESNNNQAASHEVKTEHGAVPIVIELDD